MENYNPTVTQLDVISKVIRSWLDWDAKHRETQHLTTDDGTSIMSLPVPYWPSHGMFEKWIETLDNAAAELKANNPHR
jgi:hypothetical protein